MLNESGFSMMQYYGAGVMDWFAGRIGFAGRWIKPGEHLAPLFGRSKIAPWILCGAITSGNPGLIDIKRIGDLIQCPACGGNVSDDHEGYMCLVCRRPYPIEDGIIDLRVK
jgi:hypothetical protein